MTSTSPKLHMALLALISLAVLPPRRLAAQLESGPAIGTAAPHAVTTDLDGARVDLAEWVGKGPVLLEFWATWCIPCNQLMPSVDTAFARYGDRVAFVGINVGMNETAPGVRAWLAEHRPGYRRVLFDTAATALTAYDVQATSTVVIVGSDGKVAYAGVGASQDIPAILGRVLASDPASRSR